MKLTNPFELPRPPRSGDDVKLVSEFLGKAAGDVLEAEIGKTSDVQGEGEEYPEEEGLSADQALELLDTDELPLSDQLAKQHGYTFVGRFSPEGLAIATDLGRPVVINRTGEKAFEIDADEIQPYADGFALVQMGEESWFINANGENQFRRRFDLAASFTEGLVAVSYVNKGYGYEPDVEHACYIDTTGQKVGEICDKTVPFSEGYGVVMNIVHLYEFVGHSGSPAFASLKGLELNHAVSFQEGYAAVQHDDGEWQFIDKKGRLLAKIDCLSLGVISKGFALVENETGRKFIDVKTGEPLELDSPFDSAGPFRNGLARIERWSGTERKDEYINVASEVVLDGFDQAFDFSEGVAFVIFKNRRGIWIINPKGEIQNPDDPIGNVYDPFTFQGGVARVQLNGEKCYIDKKGQKVFLSEAESMVR